MEEVYVGKPQRGSSKRAILQFLCLVFDEAALLLADSCIFSLILVHFLDPSWWQWRELWTIKSMQTAAGAGCVFNNFSFNFFRHRHVSIALCAPCVQSFLFPVFGHASYTRSICWCDWQGCCDGRASINLH